MRSAVPMKQMYGHAMRCEVLRADVFAGKRTPMVFGQPDEWLALLIESLLRQGTATAQLAEDLRQRAFDAAPATPGTLDGEPFEWIADADMRLGPVLEAFVNGRYYWMPFARLAHIKFEPPDDLRDCVWMPAHLEFENGGETLALVPDALRRQREAATTARCSWRARPNGASCGPRSGPAWASACWAPTRGEHALMDVREILFDDRRRRRRRTRADGWLNSARRSACSRRCSTGWSTTRRREKRESDDKRTLTRQALRAAVLRDLSLAVQRHRATDWPSTTSAIRMPRARCSTTDCLCCPASSRRSLQRVSMEQALKNAILQFEPRILPAHSKLNSSWKARHSTPHNRIGLQIRGMLWAQPVPLELLLRSRIDLEEGRIEIAGRRRSPQR